MPSPLTLGLIFFRLLARVAEVRSRCGITETSGAALYELSVNCLQLTHELNAFGQRCPVFTAGYVTVPKTAQQFGC